MYVRQDGRKGLPKNISVPQNYSGNAFSQKTLPPEETEEAEEPHKDIPEPIEAEAVIKPLTDEKKSFLSGFANNDDILILGLILLLSQDGFGDDILPILLMMLFLKK